MDEISPNTPPETPARFSEAEHEKMLTMPASSLSILTFLKANGLVVDEALVKDLPECLLLEHGTASRVDALIGVLHGDEDLKLHAKFQRLVPEYAEWKPFTNIVKLKKIVRVFVKNILLTTIQVPLPEAPDYEQIDENIAKLYGDIAFLIDHWNEHFYEILEKSIPFMHDLGVRYENPRLPQDGSMDDCWNDDDDDFAGYWEWEDMQEEMHETVSKDYLNLLYDLLLSMEKWVNNFSAWITVDELSRSKQTLESMIQFCGMIKDADWDILDRYPPRVNEEIFSRARNLIHTINALQNKFWKSSGSPATTPPAPNTTPEKMKTQKKASKKSKDKKKPESWEASE